MRIINGFLRLVRWKNLTIILVAQVLIWYCVLFPLKTNYGLDIFLDAFHFGIFCVSTTLIAAAGYIINDYFDIRIDLRNRPEKVIIGKVIKQRWAIFWHSLFNMVALLMAVYLISQTGYPWLLLIPAGTTVLLWIYSTHLKRMFISGNVTVAVLTALSMYIITYEPTLYSYFHFGTLVTINGYSTLNPFLIISIYAFFAFMLTWIREIVKDMEDFKGDAEEGCITMPIKIGLQKTTVFTIILAVLTCIPVIAAVFKLWLYDWKILSLYIGCFLFLPLVYFIIKINARHTTAHYEAMSKWLKWLMLAGIMTLPLYYLLR